MTHLAAGLAGAAAGGLAAAEAGGDSAALGRPAPPPGKPGDGLGPPTAPAGLGPCMHSGVRQCIDVGAKEASDRLHSLTTTALLYLCYSKAMLLSSEQVPWMNVYSHDALFKAVADLCFEPLAALGCLSSRCPDVHRSR